MSELEKNLFPIFGTPPINQAFFGHFEKKTQGQKTQAKQIIQKLNNLPTKNRLFAQKSPKVDIFCTKICPNLSFSTKQSLKLGKFREFWKKFPFC